MYFDIYYGKGYFNNEGTVFYGNAWYSEELSSCRWFDRKDCLKTLAELSDKNGYKYWINN